MYAGCVDSDRPHIRSMPLCPAKDQAMYLHHSLNLPTTQDNTMTPPAKTHSCLFSALTTPIVRCPNAICFPTTNDIAMLRQAAKPRVSTFVQSQYPCPPPRNLEINDLPGARLFGILWTLSELKTANLSCFLEHFRRETSWSKPFSTWRRATGERRE